MEMAEIEQFPSPHGDKFQLYRNYMMIILARFRPLTGINFNGRRSAQFSRLLCFRPLTGMNFNLEELKEPHMISIVSVPSRG